MSLNNFFRINLPYGIFKDTQDNWTCFNRSSQPLSSNTDSFEFRVDESEKYTFTKYSGITEKLLIELAEDNFKRDASGKINKIWLYSDTNDPLQHNTKQNWDKYFEKLKKLSSLKTKI